MPTPIELVLLFAMAGGATGLPPAAGTPGCTFATLSPDDQKRYQSRYRRRVESEGQAAAEQWIHRQACMTAEQRRAARKPPAGKDGRPCTKTRLEMRVTPGYDGAMQMTPVPVCAD